MCDFIFRECTFVDPAPNYISGIRVFALGLFATLTTIGVWWEMRRPSHYKLTPFDNDDDDDDDNGDDDDVADQQIHPEHQGNQRMQGIWDAVHENNPQKIRDIADSSPDFGTEYYNHELTLKTATPMHVACQNGFSSCVKALIDSGASAIKSDGHDRIPLHDAVLFNHIECAKILLNGVGVSAEDEVNDEEGGRNPLHVAARYGYIDMCALLIQHGFDVNEEDNYGKTPLCFSLIYNQSACAEALLKMGASIEKVLTVSNPTLFDYLHTNTLKKFKNLIKCKKLAIILLGLQRVGGHLHGNGRDVMRLIARQVMKL